MNIHELTNIFISIFIAQFQFLIFPTVIALKILI